MIEICAGSVKTVVAEPWQAPTTTLLHERRDQLVCTSNHVFSKNMDYTPIKRPTLRNKNHYISDIRYYISAVRGDLRGLRGDTLINDRKNKHP